MSALAIPRSVVGERRTLIVRAVCDWVTTWPLRARELATPWRYAARWRVGHDDHAPGAAALAFEGVVRIAELAGVGVAVVAAEVLLHGDVLRRLTEAERGVARAYFAARELDGVRVHEGSALFARGLRIAFVVGPIVKAWGRPTSSLLVHELVHVRQYRRWGWAYVAKALAAQWGQGYGYAGKRAGRLNAEQEAAWVEDQARAALGLGRRYVYARRVA